VTANNRFALSKEMENRRLAGWWHKETNRRLSCRDTIDLPEGGWEKGLINRPTTLEGNVGWNGHRKWQKDGICGANGTNKFYSDRF